MGLEVIFCLRFDSEFYTTFIQMQTDSPILFQSRGNFIFIAERKIEERTKNNPKI